MKKRVARKVLARDPDHVVRRDMRLSTVDAAWARTRRDRARGLCSEDAITLTVRRRGGSVNPVLGRGERPPNKRRSAVAFRVKGGGDCTAFTVEDRLSAARDPEWAWRETVRLDATEPGRRVVVDNLCAEAKS